jgi:hypothetical protein
MRFCSRHEGKDACIDLGSRIAMRTGVKFEPEALIARGEIRWRLVWGPEPIDSVRSVSLMRVHDGRIVESHGYIKGR